MLHLDMQNDAHPLAILLLGVGGTGKSTTASHLERLLKQRKRPVTLIRMDELRKHIAPSGVDPFSSDPHVKVAIYSKAAEVFKAKLSAGISLVIDSGLSVESIRQRLRDQIKELRIVHLTCPLPIAIWRDTKRSLRCQPHERGAFLHARALVDLLNPFQSQKFPQPGITYAFEYPHCAHLHVSTILKRPKTVAEEILTRLSNLADRFATCGRSRLRYR